MRYRTDLEVLKNSKTKCYSDGTTNTICCRAHIFKDKSDISLESLRNQEDKWLVASQHSQNIIDYLEAKGIDYDEYDERRKRYRREHPKEKGSQSGEVRNDSLKRAKDSIFDYVLNNDFDYFFTGTINPENIDSKDPNELLKPVQKWLKNMVQRYDMRYIMIAEYHKKGGIHFHGLFKADRLKLTDSGTKLYKGYKKPMSNERACKLNLDISSGRTVYNLATWNFGFSTCIQLVGDRMNTAYYVTKYITKDCKKIFGKFFWHSRSLQKPCIKVENIDFDSVDSVEHNGFKYIFTRGSDSVDSSDSLP